MHGKRWDLIRHYLNWAFFWSLLVLLLGAVIATELVGTKYQFFGPGSRWWAADKIQKGLETCPPDHVRILWFRRYPFTEEEIRDFDLSGKTLTYGGRMEEPGWWSTMISANHNGRSPLTPEQLAKVERVIDHLPDSNSTEPLEESLSIAVNRQAKLRIYHYQFDGDEFFRDILSPLGELHDIPGGL